MTFEKTVARARQKHYDLMKDLTAIERYLQQGAVKARKFAQATMNTINNTIR